MKKQVAAFFLWRLVALNLWIASAQDSAPQSSVQEPPPFQTLRFNEDYSYLHSKAERTPWESIKYIPLGLGYNWYLTLGEGQMGCGRDRFTKLRTG